MKHQNIDELGAVAEIVPFETAKKLSRRERLERWADMLDEHPGKLNALTRIEYLATRRAARGAGRQLAARGGVQGPGAARGRTCRRPARRCDGVLRAVGSPRASAVLRLPLFRQHDRSRAGGAAAPYRPGRFACVVCVNACAARAVEKAGGACRSNGACLAIPPWRRARRRPCRRP